MRFEASSACSELRAALATSPRISRRRGSEAFSSWSYPQALIEARIVNNVSLVSKVTLGGFWARHTCTSSAQSAARAERRKQQPRKNLHRAGKLWEIPR